MKITFTGGKKHQRDQSPKSTTQALLFPSPNPRTGSLNIISEHILEAANSTSINAPSGASEFTLSGLTPSPCTVISAPRVAEAIFSVECRLLSTQEYTSRNPATPGRKTGVIAVVEGVRFWVREDALNEERNLVDPAVLRPVARMGGITYARVREGVEIPRPDWKAEVVNKGREGMVRGEGSGEEVGGKL